MKKFPGDIESSMTADGELNNGFVPSHWKGVSHLPTKVDVVFVNRETDLRQWLPLSTNSKVVEVCCIKVDTDLNLAFSPIPSLYPKVVADPTIIDVVLPSVVDSDVEVL